MKSFFNEKLTKCVLTIIVILIGYFLLLPANTFAEVTAPINFRVDRYAESEDPSTKYATLQWDAISDVVSYNLYTVGSSDIFFDSSPTNAYTLKFNKNSIFYFKVTAVDKNGREGSKSQTVSVEFPSAGVSLTSPKNLRISQTETTANKSVKKVHIFWDPVPGATSYIVYKNAGTTYYYHITVDTNLYEMDIPVSSTFYIAVSAKKNN
ncbi:MAG: hypothetical protein HYZ02_02665, partial [Candidatus Levybacteria bacterium]|nr:hypothetical protein [Candidatus Levybacteria bacterium]